ncbi:MAG TPA: BrnT family toxin [Caulobacteraceae bacterium]
MRITYDAEKRALTLAKRGLDFEDARQIFESVHLQMRDDRVDYGEERFISVGRVDGEPSVVVWTPRDGGRRIISMRKCNARERRRFRLARL